MTSKNIKNISASIVLLLFVLLISIRYCNKKNADINIINEQAKNKAAYNDTVEFLRGQLDLQQEKNYAQTERVEALEAYVDSLTKKHQSTKQKIKPVLDRFNNDTGYVLAPNEYVNECEDCFNVLGKYKKENIQLRFERDSYDDLMKSQSKIDSNRIAELEWEKTKLQKPIPKCDATGKLKFSAMGMLSNPFIPKAGGFGLIYEDKKSNEYGAHVLFSGSGNIYIFNIAKTISLRRKK